MHLYLYVFVSIFARIPEVGFFRLQNRRLPHPPHPVLQSRFQTTKLVGHEQCLAPKFQVNKSIHVPKSSIQTLGFLRRGFSWISWCNFLRLVPLILWEGIEPMLNAFNYALGVLSLIRHNIRDLWQSSVTLILLESSPVKNLCVFIRLELLNSHNTVRPGSASMRRLRWLLSSFFFLRCMKWQKSQAKPRWQAPFLIMWTHGARQSSWDGTIFSSNMVFANVGNTHYINNTFAVAFKYVTLWDGTWNAMKSLRQQSGQTILIQPLDSVRWLSKVKIKYHKTHEEIKICALAQGECQYFDYMNISWSLQLTFADSVRNKKSLFRAMGPHPPLRGHGRAGPPPAVIPTNHNPPVKGMGKDSEKQHSPGVM